MRSLGPRALNTADSLSSHTITTGHSVSETGEEELGFGAQEAPGVDRQVLGTTRVEVHA